MSLEITQILRQHLPALVKGHEVDPSPEVLDITWRHMKETNRHFLENAITYAQDYESNIYDELDNLLMDFVDCLDDQYAWELRTAYLKIFRAFAKAEILGYEEDIKNAYLHE